MTRYFLDTTAHIERWAGDSERQDYVRNALGTENHTTSTHALREWKHIVEGTSVEILNALGSHPTTLSELFARLSQGWGRSAGHRWRVLSMACANESTVDLDLIRVRTERILRLTSDEMFHRGIDEVRNGSECGLAENVATRSEKGDWTFENPTIRSEYCKQTHHICRQDDDLESKLTELNAAAEALTASTDHRAMGKAADEAVADRKKRKGKACYSRLGDVSLALERADNDVVLTTDRSFEVMAPALGISVQRFAPTPTP